MSPDRLRVAVIGGGANCEHEVSLASAASAVRALAGRHEAVPLVIGPDGRWLDADRRDLGFSGAAEALVSCDVVLPVVHGPAGEDGTLAALCELARLPYVGSGVGAGALAMDKWATKLVAQAVGVCTAPGVLLTEATVRDFRMTHPVVVKPVAAGSSHGVRLARRPEELAEALTVAFALDSRVLVEDVVIGREIDLAVVGRPDGSRIVSPALEIVVDGLFDHATKYGGSADFRLPAALDDNEAAALRRAAVRVFDALGCDGLARVDFFLTSAGPVLIEVNTVPGLTEHSQAPLMLAAAGLPYPDLLDLLVRDAMHRGPRRPGDGPGPGGTSRGPDGGHSGPGDTPGESDDGHGGSDDGHNSSGGAAAPVGRAGPAASPESAAGAGVVRTRETWPDVAKGTCILLVVLWHVLTKHYLKIDWHTSIPVPGLWGALGEGLLPLRMPLFFTISGLFAAGVVARPWGQVLGRRALPLAYLFLLWTAIQALVLAFTPGFDTLHAHGPAEYLRLVTVDPTNLWYLEALVLYTVVARVSRGWPTVPLLLGAAALSALAATHVLWGETDRNQVLANLTFFLAGLRLATQVRGLAARASTRRLLITVATFAGLVGVMETLGAQTWWGVWPAVSVVGVTAGVTAAAWTARQVPSVARRLAYLGRRTLPVYLMHMPLLAVADRALRAPLFPVPSPAVAPAVALAVVEPIAVGAALVGICLRLHRVLAERAAWVVRAPWAGFPPSAPVTP